MRAPKTKAALAAFSVCGWLLSLPTAPASAQNNDEYTTAQAVDLLYSCIADDGKFFDGEFGGGEWMDCQLPDGTSWTCDRGPRQTLWTCYYWGKGTIATPDPDTIRPTGTTSGTTTSTSAHT